MQKKIAIVQSNYIPWKGYFDLINLVDEFILLDDVQYTKRDWRNRNLIKTLNGVKWLTIPVVVKNRYNQQIKDVVISDPRWPYRHWRTIVNNYSKAKYFSLYKDMFDSLYSGINEKYLSKINYYFITFICRLLDISVKISWSMEYNLKEGKTERLVDFCKQAGASEYISGPSAKNYINEDVFKNNGIRLRYMDYSGYPEYNQLYPPFVHKVSIIDLIFNEGPNAKKYMLNF